MAEGPYHNSPRPGTGKQKELSRKRLRELLESARASLLDQGTQIDTFSIIASWRNGDCTTAQAAAALDTTEDNFMRCVTIAEGHARELLAGIPPKMDEGPQEPKLKPPPLDLER